MADGKGKDEIALIKYRYVEEFPESIDPETGNPFEGIDSPKMVETELFGKRELHRIAKVKWTETKYTQVYETKGTDGSLQEKEFIIRVYEQEMGDVGGWIESKQNLAQAGDCWVAGDAVVVGDAQVIEDAEVSGNAEVGEFAVVGGKAKVFEEAGIAGFAHVNGEAMVYGDKEELEKDVDEKWKKGMPRKRIAVGDHATVKGTVKGTAKVYGEAYVGLYSQVSDKAQVFGNAYVKGDEDKWAYIDDEARVYDHAIVNGTVGGKSKVVGRAHVGSGGELDGDIYLKNGVVFGLISGKATLDMFSMFIGKGSKLVFYKEGEKRPPLAFKERDMESDKMWVVMDTGSDIIYKDAVLIIGKDCTLEYCSFYGRVVIDETRARYCSFRDCAIKDGDLFDCGVNSCAFSGVDAEKSILYNTYIDGGRVKNSTLQDGVAAAKVNWDGVSASSFATDIKTAKGCGISGATRNDQKVDPIAYPYAKKSNYESRGMYGATVFEKPYERKKVDTIKTKYGEFYDTKDGRMQMRYAERWGKISSLLKPMQERAKELYELAYEGVITDEQNYERFSLGCAINWVGSAACTMGLWDLSDDLWTKTYERLEKSAGGTLGNTYAHLYAPFGLKFVWTKSHYYQYPSGRYLPDYTQPVTLVPFHSSYHDDYIYPKLNGMYSSYPKGYYQYICYMDYGGFPDYTPYGGFNQFIHDVADGNAIMLKDKEDTYEEIPYDDLAIPYYEEMEKLNDELFESGWRPPPWLAEEEPTPEQKKIMDKMSALSKAYDDAMSNRLYGPEEAARKVYEQKMAVADEYREDYWKEYDEREKEKDYVKAREAAVIAVRHYLTEFHITDKKTEIATWANQIGDILGTLLYGNPSLEEVESLKKRAAELHSKYLQVLNEENNKRRAEQMSLTNGNGISLTGGSGISITGGNSVSIT